MIQIIGYLTQTESNDSLSTANHVPIDSINFRSKYLAREKKITTFFSIHYHRQIKMNRNLIKKRKK